MAREAEIVSPRAGLTRALLGGWALLVYLFLFAPIALLVAFSFNANRYGTFPFTGWTTHWYGQVFDRYHERDPKRRRERVADLVVAEDLAVPVGRPAGEGERPVAVRVEAERDEQRDRREQEEVHERRPDRKSVV